MSIQNVLTELWPAITQQQGQKAVAALAATQTGPGIPAGLTNAQKAERCLKLFIRSVVSGADVESKQAEINAFYAQNAIDYPEA